MQNVREAVLAFYRAALSQRDALLTAAREFKLAVQSPPDTIPEATGTRELQCVTSDKLTDAIDYWNRARDCSAVDAAYRRAMAAAINLPYLAGKLEAARDAHDRLLGCSAEDLDFARVLELHDPAFDALADCVVELPPSPAEIIHDCSQNNPRPSQKRSTERGGAEAKLIAALTKHHQYADGGCLNQEPIGNNELAKAAGVSPSTASTFFNDKFQGHTKYKALCRDASKLIAALKLLNDEFAPFHLLGAASPDLAAPEQDDADSD
jgi:hypothetical protein